MASIALRTLTALTSRGGRGGRLLSFFFHRVLEKPDPMMPGEVDAARFEQILSWIGEQFRVLPPRLACEQLAAGRLPPRAAIITFDDGYRDNHDVALPLLQRHRMTAAFFVATGYLGDGVQFNDRLTEAVRALRGQALDAAALGLGVLPAGSTAQRLQALERIREAAKYLLPAARWEAVERIESACGVQGRGLQRGRVMMTPDEVRALAAHGMEIGGHTRLHPILQSVDDITAAQEIAAGRDDLAGIVGEAPLLFAYPNGKPGTDFAPRHAEMAREAGFAFAFTTQCGIGRSATDAMLIPRFMPWNIDRLRFQLQALRVTAGQ